MDRYLAEGEARGLAMETVVHRRRELERWGSWLNPSANVCDAIRESIADGAPPCIS